MLRIQIQIMQTHIFHHLWFSLSFSPFLSVLAWWKYLVRDLLLVICDTGYGDGGSSGATIVIRTFVWMYVFIPDLLMESLMAHSFIHSTLFSLPSIFPIQNASFTKSDEHACFSMFHYDLFAIFSWIFQKKKNCCSHFPRWKINAI